MLTKLSKKLLKNCKKELVIGWAAMKPKGCLIIGPRCSKADNMGTDGGWEGLGEVGEGW
jgi:hypothetical protein